jgi:hypothetical protein
MREIWIPEILIALFYLVFLLRAPVRRLRSLEGLVWLPPLALVISGAIFPAYGFRAEAIPLLVYGIVLNLLNLPSLGAASRRRQDGDFLVHGTIFTLVNFVLLTAVMALVFGFSPEGDTLPDPAARTLRVRDELRGRDYFLRFYGEEPGRPLLVLAPHPEGSALAVDKLCGKLADRGFSVLTWSRRGFDSPALGENNWIYPAPADLLLRLFLLPSASRSKRSNDLGRVLEEGRREDVEFILSHITANRELAAPERPLFLAGFGAGGSALIMLASTPGFAARNRNVRGIIAVESYLWSAYKEQPPPEEPLPSTPGIWGRILRGWHGVKRWISSILPKKLVPGEIYAPEIPLMVLLSDRVLEAGYRESSYKAVLETLAASWNSSLLAAAGGAGPLDYSDCSDQYPLVSALFPGEAKTAWNNGDFSGGAAGLMAGFAGLVLGPGSRYGAALSPVKVPAQGLYTKRRAWTLADPGYIMAGP